MDRKEFLSLLGLSVGGAVVASCLGGCTKDSVAPSNVDFTLDLSSPANAKLLNNGGYLVTNGVIVAKTINGDYVAVSASCTHEGTTVQYQSSNNRFHCPNHGANFDTNGSVINGPATRSLHEYNTSLSGNTLRVYS